MPVNEADISRYITDTLEGVDVVSDSGTNFFFYNPDSSVPPDHKFPFVTLVTSDLYDQFSNLDRPGVFRLNIGVGKETFRSLFGENAGGFDFTVLDQVMPHPVYGMMYWVCVLNPSDGTFEAKVKPLLAEAHALAAGKYDRKAARR